MANHDGNLAWDQEMVDIVEYVYHFKIERREAWERAQIALLDSLGCAIESQSTSVECRDLLGPNVPGTQVNNGCRLPGTGYQLDPVKGAFDLGTCIRYLDHNDALGGAEAGHPSDNLGAILSLCDWLSQSDGRTIFRPSAAPPLTIRTALEALIKAYEIQGCFQLRNAFNAYGHDHTVLVKLASTAVSAWILGLTKTQALAAISHVFMDGCPLRVYRNAPNTIPRKGWAAGDACSRALQLVFLAYRGQPGARTVLTAPRWGFYDNLFGGKTFVHPRKYQSWVVENVFFKCVPAEGHGISAIDATLQHARRLRTRGLDVVRHVAKIRLRTHEACLRIISKTGILHNAADRDHCVQYMIAVALLKGSLLEAIDYTDASPWASDPAVDIIRERIEVFEDTSLTDDYLNPDVKTAANGVTVVLDSGEILDEVIVHHPLGHVDNPGTPVAVNDKFWRNMGSRFTRQEILRITEGLADRDMKMCDWIGLWVREGFPLSATSRL